MYSTKRKLEDVTYQPSSGDFLEINLLVDEETKEKMNEKLKSFDENIPEIQICEQNGNNFMDLKCRKLLMTLITDSSFELEDSKIKEFMQKSICQLFFKHDFVKTIAKLLIKAINIGLEEDFVDQDGRLLFELFDATKYLLVCALRYTNISARFCHSLSENEEFLNTLALLQTRWAKDFRKYLNVNQEDLLRFTLIISYNIGLYGGTETLDRLKQSRLSSSMKLYTRVPDMAFQMNSCLFIFYVIPETEDNIIEQELAVYINQQLKNHVDELGCRYSAYELLKGINTLCTVNVENIGLFIETGLLPKLVKLTNLLSEAELLHAWQILLKVAQHNRPKVKMALQRLKEIPNIEEKSLLKKSIEFTRQELFNYLSV